jgi:phosphate butyryltransferase
MPLPGFDELFAAADASRPEIAVVAAGGADITVLQALAEARRRGWVRPAVTGKRSEIERHAADHGLSLDGVRIVEADEPARAAVELVRCGEARLLMKGQIATPDLMRAVLDSNAGLRTGRVICQVVLMQTARDGRRFLMADTGITPRPSLEQKIDVLRSAVQLAHVLGEAAPRVALMAATEKPTDSLPDTHEAAEIARRGVEGCVVQGPLSFDLAYATESGQRKGVGGPVAGAADVMIFPDLTSANLTCKAMMYAADCAFGGVLMGAACPVVFMSRADSFPTRLRSLALALRLA